MYNTTIVIPCHNEENRMPVPEYTEFLSRNTVNIIFVDDGSTDGTLGLLEGLKETHPDKVFVIHLPINSGKAEAVRRGILSASDYTNPDIIGFMDADLSTPFKELTWLLDAFTDKKIEFVFGSRMLRIGAKIKRYYYRHYLGRVAATIVSIYLKIPVYDTQCGAKFFRAEFAGQLFNEPFVSRWLFDVEIFKRIALLGINVEDCAIELPLHTWIEKGGSKIKITDFLRLPIDFYRVVNHYVKKKNATRIKPHDTRPLHTKKLL